MHSHKKTTADKIALIHEETEGSKTMKCCSNAVTVHNNTAVNDVSKRDMQTIFRRSKGLSQWRIRVAKQQSFSAKWRLWSMFWNRIC